MQARAARVDLDDGDARVRHAAPETTTQDVLHRVAVDPDIMVRATVAMNPGAVPQSNYTLTPDADERVRALLRCKLAGLLPSLPDDDRSSALAHVVCVLGTLVADEAVRVRSAIAEIVQPMAEAPCELVLRLARDAELPVSEPVIRLSPLLTDADLMALLATPPHAAAATTVAKHAGLSAAVADVVAAQADTGAIRALLANGSAAIQETTLNALVGKAAYHADCHEPLVHRPGLSAQSTRALSGFIAQELLEQSLQRADLDPSIVAEVRSRVASNLAPEVRSEPSGDDKLLSCLRRLNAARGLTETELLEAARKGDYRRVTVMLAVASGVSLAAVDRAVSMRSAKALISLAWKAGFSMRAGNVAQAMLGQLAPGTLLLPTPEGGFPLSPDEMSWQIEVLSEPGR